MEPQPTAWLLAVSGALIAVSVLASRLSGRVGLPLALLFMLVGMLAGSEGVGGVWFDDFAFAFRMGTLALVLILFDGGLNTRVADIRQVLAPAAVLATAGVVGSALVLGLGAHLLLDMPWTEALLLGAVVSSTDAAAVFSVLRGSGLQLRRPLGSLIEVESGINDPMAVILTISITTVLARDEPIGLRILFDIAAQMLVGAIAGVAIGAGTRWVLRRLPRLAGGLVPVLTTAMALVAFGVPTLALGSGFLAVYLAGVVMGGGDIPYRAGVLRVHDALAWLSQVTMFLMLGLLVFPSQLLPVAPEGLALAALLALVARPVIVWVCLLPFRLGHLPSLYVGWVGLRGAVPIILATFPVLYEVPGAQRIFHVVFFVVVLSALFPGMTVAWVTRRLGLQVEQPPPPPAALEIYSAVPLGGEIRSWYLAAGHRLHGRTIASLDFPPSSTVLMVLRGAALIAAKGSTCLQAGTTCTCSALPRRPLPSRRCSPDAAASRSAAPRSLPDGERPSHASRSSSASGSGGAGTSADPRVRWSRTRSTRAKVVRPRPMTMAVSTSACGSGFA